MSNGQATVSSPKQNRINFFEKNRRTRSAKKNMFNGKVNNRNVSMSGKPNRRNRREVLGKFFFFFWCQIVVV